MVSVKYIQVACHTTDSEKRDSTLRQLELGVNVELTSIGVNNGKVINVSHTITSAEFDIGDRKCRGFIYSA